MPQYHRILWNEGLFLTQHHFQQFDAYLAGDRTFQFRSRLPFGWGAARLVIDTEAVANRQFTLAEFDGILPDGTSVRAPAVDDPPASRSFESLFGPTERVLSVYLGIPRLRPGTPGVRLDKEQSHSPTRYEQAFAMVPDEVTGEHEREIGYARKRLLLLFSGEELEGFDTVQIAEIERSPEGVDQLRESYVPPLLAIGASGWLTKELRGVLETASAKSQSLADQVRQRTPTLTEFSTTDLPNFLKLHTVNAYIPALSHHLQHPGLHPEDLFGVLAQFAGHLSAFKVGEHPRDLPGYRHDRLESTFRPLIAKLRELLEAVVEAHFVRIPLQRVDPSRCDGQVDNPELFASSDFYLGVSADVSESHLAAEFPKHAKVVSPDKIARLIGGNLPGVNLIFLQLPPAAIPRRAGMVYFRIDPRGDRWEFIKKASQIAIYAPPGEFPNWEVECLAVER
ncbi:MAG: type VI secretion system baseplate subunit TssK [candidate division Zixibacteria bacterium]|nr:type VI secretion system baseplate subunit TssK [candidate division Zixibacteria bacterium]